MVVRFAHFSAAIRPSLFLFYFILIFFSLHALCYDRPECLSTHMIKPGLMPLIYTFLRCLAVYNP